MIQPVSNKFNQQAYRLNKQPCAQHRGTVALPEDKAAKAKKYARAGAAAVVITAGTIIFLNRKKIYNSFNKAKLKETQTDGLVEGLSAAISKPKMEIPEGSVKSGWNSIGEAIGDAFDSVVDAI